MILFLFKFLAGNPTVDRWTGRTVVATFDELLVSDKMVEESPAQVPDIIRVLVPKTKCYS